MNIKLMRKIDWFMGIPLCYFLSLFENIKKFFFKKESREIKKILVIKFFGIGSIILTSPMLASLKDKFPNAKIYFLTFKQNEEILNLLNLTQKNYFINTKNIFKFIFSTFKTILQLRREKIDIVFDLEFFAKFPLVIASLINAKRKAGFYLVLEPWRKGLLDYYGFYNHYFHVKDIFMSLVYLVSENDPYYIKFDDYKRKYGLLKINLSETDKKDMMVKLEKLGTSVNHKKIIVNPNAGPELAPELKKWPKEKFSELIVKIGNAYPDWQILLIGSKSERAFVEKIGSGALEKNRRLQIINLAGETTLKELVNLFQLSSLFITIDSGPMHLASLVDIPIIGIFGAGTPILYGPLGKKSIALCKNLYSVPMLTVYNGKQSELKENIPVSLITVKEVFEKVNQILNN